MKKDILIIVMVLIAIPLIIESSSSVTAGISSTNKGILYAPPTNVIITHVTIPFKGVKGCNIQVSSTIKNRGTNSYNNIRINYYLKNDRSKKVYYIGYNHLPDLDAGTSNNQSASLYIRPQINTGNYHILMTISTENGVSKKVIGKYKYNNKIRIVGPEYFIFDNRIGGNITQNPQIDKCIPKTDFAKTIFNLEKKGSVILKFGDGHGSKLLILAGIHGNETAANIAIMKYLEYIKDKKIHGTLYIIPFAIPVDTALNTRFYNGVDPNRIADVKGSPAWKIAHFAKKKGINYILDVHTGAQVTPEGYLFLNPSAKGSKEEKWASYIANKSGCSKKENPLQKGMLRTEAYKLGINTITLEVERDNTDILFAAETELKMIIAACKYFRFPQL